ncbi:MAG TPA: phosphonopyruvate decarboxylase [Candidatus Treponema faecavium]|nr:phosphonopyruvate decarboxylase [Candidatus Treponema faecavium]
MITPQALYKALAHNGTEFFTGVPDSLLKSFCAYVTDTAPEKNHIICANEGTAAALAAGYYFASGKIPLVYMQNSGEGNMINPLLSLIDPEVYAVPLLIIIGWRGEPGVHDEPQHIKQGKVTCGLLDAIHIPYQILTDDEAQLCTQLQNVYAHIAAHSAPYALIVRKGTFAEYTLKRTVPQTTLLKREEAIEKIICTAPQDAAFVCTTGMASRELYEIREKYGMDHRTDFLTVGSMGHASQIALGIAMQQPQRPVFCLDGDGAFIMHMGGMTTIGTRKPKNLVHIVLNNGAHDSVGGQPTVGLDIDIPMIAKACGYTHIYSVSTAQELSHIAETVCTAFLRGENDLTFIEIKVAKGARKDLGRPKSTPQENKKALMEFLNND